MTNKDFREIQVSSTLLVVIFLGVLALGVFIFLLGVSVGKKQTAATSAPTQIVTQQIPEPAKEPDSKPVGSDPAADGTPQDKAAAPTSVQDVFTSQPPATSPSSTPPAPKTSTKPASKTSAETKAAPAAKTGLYYVQVAAFTDKGQAQAAADRYKKQGYTAVVANPKPTDTKTWYRVRLGGYSTRDRAVNLLEKLNTAAGKKTDFRVVQD